MDRRRYLGGRVKGTQLAVAAFLLSLVLLLAVGGVTVYVLTHKTTSNADFSKELREVLVENCKNNGNALRKVVREGIENEIGDPHDPRLREILPDVPVKRIEEIVEEENAKRRVRLKKAHDVNCSAQYPETP